MSALDPEVTARLAAELRRDDLLRILRTFDDDVARLAGEVTAAAAAGEAEALRHAAHALAGAAAALGAHRLEAAARLGMAAAAPEDPAALAHAVSDEAAAVRAALAALCDDPPGG